MKMKCKSCGISDIGDTLLDVIKNLSGKGCTFSSSGSGMKSWCVCGEINSFEPEEEKMVLENGEVVGAGILIWKDQKVLLGNRVDGQGWSCPGGKVEVGERYIDAAIRETYEELGITVDPSSLIFIGKFHMEVKVNGVMRKVVSYEYMTESFSGDIKVNTDEFSEYRWFDVIKDCNSIKLYPLTEMILPEFGYRKDKQNGKDN